MATREGVPPAAIINIVLFSLIMNVFVMGIGFAVVSGIAFFQGHGISGLFAGAAGFLALIASAIIVLRNFLVTLIEDLAF